MYDFNKKRNQKVVAIVIIVVIAAMLVTTFVSSLVELFLKYGKNMII